MFRTQTVLNITFMRLIDDSYAFNVHPTQFMHYFYHYGRKMGHVLNQEKIGENFFI